VSWAECQEFVKMVNEKERGSGWVYRLPTEAEWEYACRGGATSEEECSYHFYFDQPTNDLSSHQANFNGAFPFGKVKLGPYLARPARVGAYPPNKLGLCDMHGNVWQWCANPFDPTDPRWASLRPSRGGSWLLDSTVCAAGFRNGDRQSHRSNFIGFRLARVPSALGK
jgi:formylglycine-generating enzyme required for sulfatase activity